MIELLSLIVFLPLIGALIPHRLGALAGASAAFLLTILELFRFSPGAVILERRDWIPSLHVQYEVALDGANFPIFVAVGLVFTVLQLLETKDRPTGSGLRTLLGVAESTLLGLCVSQSLFLTAFLLMVSILPFFLMISIYGEKGEQSAYRFLTIGVLGNGLIFVLLLVVHGAVTPQSFSLAELTGKMDPAKAQVGLALLLASFLCRLPVWPMHGWFIDCCRSSDSTLLTAFVGGLVPVLLFVLFRLSTQLFGAQISVWSDVFVGVGCLLLFLGALGALSQRHFRSFVGAVTMWFIGLTLFGVAGVGPEGIAGSLYVTAAMSLSLAAISILFGVLEKRSKSQVSLDGERRTLGGLVHTAPMLTAVGAVSLMSVAGLPGLAGFSGYTLIILGVLEHYPWSVGIATIAMMIMAGACVRMFREVFLGPAGSHVSDLSRLEALSTWPFVVSLVGVGIFPRLFLDLIYPVIRVLAMGARQ